VTGIIDGEKPTVLASDGTMATKVGFAMTTAFKEGKVVRL
jgi:hypothetical protein